MSIEKDVEISSKKYTDFKEALIHILYEEETIDIKTLKLAACLETGVKERTAVNYLDQFCNDYNGWIDVDQVTRLASLNSRYFDTLKPPPRKRASRPILRRDS